ncbi:homing endonuclease associated repeat-containing protein [Solitalea koreensis]|uniref:homing endonuclease associated repeat-containing protein n=1 Tax=Solitalea koreensis TaxID=543615 RepID=UPI001C8F6E28
MSEYSGRRINCRHTKCCIEIKEEYRDHSEYEEHGKFHPSTLQRKFGSWFKVLELAQLEASRSKLFEEVWIKPRLRQAANRYASCLRYIGASNLCKK